MINNNNILYSTSLAVEKSGVSLKQLYYWEQLGIITPRYEKFGMREFRRYSQGDIERLKEIRQLLCKGYTLRAAVRKLDPALSKKSMRH